MTSSGERRPLWEWRATRRLSKTALALAANVSRNTIADIESGKRLVVGGRRQYWLQLSRPDLAWRDVRGPYWQRPAALRRMEGER